MRVKSDLAEGSSISDGVNGLEATRVFSVDGLQGDAAAKISSAFAAAGIPQRGNFHPVYPALRVVTRRARAVHEDLVLIECIYRAPRSAERPADDTAEPIISVGSTLQSTPVDTDIEGVPIHTTYTYPDTYPDAKRAGTTEVQRVDVEVLKPYETITFSRRETVAPVEKSAAYSGKVNQFPYLGYPARSLLCRIEGISYDGGDTYDTTYELQYKPDLWDVVVTFADPLDGRPVWEPDDLARQTFRVYEEIDFSGLRLSI